VPSLKLPKLYAIVDVDVCARAGRTPMEVTRAFLSAGARFLQLRAKTWESGAFLDLACEMTTGGGPAAMVIVNDRADIAAIAEAAGVHVGQTDLRPAHVRRIVGGRSVVGLSTHSDGQLTAAIAEPVSYVAVGPVFGTGTKETGYDAVGLDAVRRAAAITGPAGVPRVAIGGITLERAPAVIDSGADSVAVISDLLIGDPESRARAFISALH
jgi:thiamine-phosphate pyrophosphorylase